jgi:hypothetical protein
MKENQSVVGNIRDMSDPQTVATCMLAHKNDFDFLARTEKDTKAHKQLKRDTLSGKPNQLNGLMADCKTISESTHQTPAKKPGTEQENTDGELTALRQKEKILTNSEKQAQVLAKLDEHPAENFKQGPKGEPMLSFVGMPGHKFYLSDNLISCARKNDLEGVKLAQISGGSVDHMDSNGSTALGHACRYCGLSLDMHLLCVAYVDLAFTRMGFALGAVTQK